jgi:CUG-BP- and ETR3-like factor
MLSLCAVRLVMQEVSSQPVSEKPATSLDGTITLPASLAQVVTGIKLFVGQLPKDVTNEYLKPMFEEYGNVLEVAVIRNKATGESRGNSRAEFAVWRLISIGCAFVTFSTREECEKAIAALHGSRTFPGVCIQKRFLCFREAYQEQMRNPMQVKYADGELEKLGAVITL